MGHFVLDYITDSVGSRVVNIGVLITTLGPLFHFMYIIQTQLDVHYPPFIYMLGWFILPTLICLFILVPLQIGNNNFKQSNMTFVSIIWCLLLFAYEVYACFILVQFTNIPWFYFICLLASVFASIISALYYIFMLLTKSSYITHAQETAEQYQDIIPTNNDENIENDAIFESINKQHSYLRLMREFLYPSIPIMKDNYTIFYPSRIIVTMFLSVCGVIGCNEILLYYYEWSGEQLQMLDKYINTLESIDFNKRFELENIHASQQYAVHLMKAIYFMCKPISDALLLGGFIGLLFGLFGSIIIIRSYKQRIIYMRYGYNIDGKKINQYQMHDYNVWWSAKFISTVACSVVFGSVIMAVLWAVVFGLISTIDVWKLFIETDVWKYVMSYLIYYLLEYIIFQYLIIKIWFKNKVDNKYVGLIFIINDLTYIPLAILFCLIKIVQSIVICMLSFLRPDLSIFPGYLSVLDHSHLSFVSNIKLNVENENIYYQSTAVETDTDADEYNDAMQERY
eukprot:126753_1